MHRYIQVTEVFNKDFLYQFTDSFECTMTIMFLSYHNVNFTHAGQVRGDFLISYGSRLLTVADFFKGILPLHIIY